MRSQGRRQRAAPSGEPAVVDDDDFDPVSFKAQERKETAGV